MNLETEPFQLEDSKLVFNLLDSASEQFFQKLKAEIDWQDMYHRGGLVPRQVAIQGSITEQARPLYRHPADEEPELKLWTPTVNHIRQRVSEILGIDINHALIQLYRNGHDWIGKHADKTLDISRNTPIVNVSFGATRKMQISPKTNDKQDKKPTYRVPLPNNSMLVFGWETNRKFHHMIKPDRRQANEKNPEELSFKGERISLTFRSIGTFVTPQGQVFGQGSCHKTFEALQNSGFQIDGHEGDQAMNLLKAFSAENKNADFDWDAHYGQGFEILNLKVVNRKDK
ncbi:MAG: alpha-ketoglutarate-dependent dioxygenase AlkB [Planctomycetota bacterium]|nr:alpha-ketoglutarate-dependent dioxygenase AlkB [Planctomycetota bacterium]